MPTAVCSAESWRSVLNTLNSRRLDRSRCSSRRRRGSPSALRSSPICSVDDLAQRGAVGGEVLPHLQGAILERHDRHHVGDRHLRVEELPRVLVRAELVGQRHRRLVEVEHQQPPVLIFDGARRRGRDVYDVGDATGGPAAAASGAAPRRERLRRLDDPARWRCADIRRRRCPARWLSSKTTKSFGGQTLDRLALACPSRRRSGRPAASSSGTWAAPARSRAGARGAGAGGGARGCRSEAGRAQAGACDAPAVWTQASSLYRSSLIWRCERMSHRIRTPHSCGL